jgi:uncharacterized protein (TIGR02270 family)
VGAAVIGTADRFADGASFAWVLRDLAARLPNVGLARLAAFDERLQAHLEGVRLDHAAWWARFEADSETAEAGEFFVATVMALESDPRRCPSVIEAAAASPEHARGVVSALGWIRTEPSDALVHSLLDAPSPAWRRIGVAAAATRRRHPGPILGRAAGDPNPDLRARALRAIGELGALDARAVVTRALAAEEWPVRLAAARTAALLSRDAAAITALQQLVESPVIPADAKRAAVTVAGRAMDPAAGLAWQRGLSGRPETMRLAIMMAGSIGDPHLIPWLIDQIGTAELARVAGEAFTTITGVGIDFRDLDRDRPAGFEAGPSEDPGDEVVELDPDENLPWPDPERVGRWWQQHRHALPAGVPHLAGRPVSDAWVERVLRDGHQRQRFEAAVAQVVSHPGRPMFNVRAPAHEQIALLGTPEAVIR